LQDELWRERERERERAGTLCRSGVRSCVDKTPFAFAWMMGLLCPPPCSSLHEAQVSLLKFFLLFVFSCHDMKENKPKSFWTL